ncbi:MAG: YesL family protein [Lachnospiraceae bacterium]|nr:YesL family protein [Lachnospiraceae bacterium]
MGNVFSLDSPLFRVCSKIADIFLLNLIFVLTCIPVITIGASLTALHFISMKMIKGEEGYIIRGFLKAFKENFKQATGIYLIMALIGTVLGTDLYFWMNLEGTISVIMSAVSIAACCAWILGLIYVFVLQATFENPIKRTIINSFLVALQQLPITLFLAVYYGVIVYFILQFFIADVFMVLYGFGLAAFGSAVLYRAALKKYVERARAGSEEAASVEGKEEKTK